MERRVRGNSHARCGVGENPKITSKDYLSLLPGAFSSYDGEDFRAVLEETARVAEPDVSIPRPEAGTWKSAGRVLGGNFSIAWAVYDAEFFGVAQRRRRIFLVADLAGHSAAEILFEREGLPGYTAAKRRTWEDIAAAAGIRRADAGGAEGGAGNRGLTAYAANGRDEVRPMYGTATTITAHPSLRQETILLEREVCLNDQGGMRMDVSEGVSGTLRADMGGHPPIVLGSEQGGTEVAFDLCPTLTASAGISVHPSGKPCRRSHSSGVSRRTRFLGAMMHFASDTYWFPTPFSSPLHNVPTTR